MLTHKKKRLVSLSNCKAEPVEWLWPGRVAAGKLTLLDGDPSQGKSLLSLDLAARLSTGRPLPDCPGPGQPLSVVLVGCEDGLQDTIHPRLLAAGADLERVQALLGREQPGQADAPLLLPDDCDLLRETIVETGARLVIIDPLTAVLPASTNGTLLREALGKLAGIAEQLRAAIMLVRHLTKGGASQRAVYRGSGSMAIVGSARTAFLVAPHPDQDDLRVLACTKNNLTGPPPALGFRIIESPQGEPVVQWQGEVDVSADDLVLESGRPLGAAVRAARDFLQELLDRGACPATEVLQRAAAEAISERTLKRAKRELRVLSRREESDGATRWIWQLRPRRRGPAGLVGPELIAYEEAEAQRRTDEAVAQIMERHEKWKAAQAAAQARNTANSSQPLEGAP